MSESRVAIITGAGSGIGRATALALGASGWRCTLVGRRSDALEQTALLMRERAPSSQSLALAMDVGEAGAAQRIVNATIDHWHAGIAALVNNAATLLTGPMHQMSDDDLRATFTINVLAPARLARSVWPVMREAGGGRIVNISSLASVDPFPGLGAYGMSKAALEGLTRALNKEGKREGIRAFSVQLGAVETAMLRSFASEKMLPRSKARDPHEVGEAIASIVRGERDDQSGGPIVIA